MINERTIFALKSIQQGVNFADLCKEYGISRKTGYKWKNRFLSEGGQSVLDQSRRPHSNPAQLGEDVVCKIIQLHECHPSWGPKKIQEVYLRAEGSAPSLSSFQRIFDKSGWVKKRKKRQHHQSGRLFDGRKATQPNEVWTVDFKGYWFTQDGQRCEPLTVRDEYSRYILQIKAMDSAKTEAVQSVFQQLFQRHGLPRAIRSDNGTPFASVQALLGLSRLSVWWLALGIDLERGRPGKPQDNGAHERMHRDIREQLQSCAQHDIATQQAAFDVWRRTFNYERPHEALGMKTPAELYERSQTTFDPNVTDITYKGMISRKVQVTGKISLDSRNIRISSSLAGWSVGLKPTDSQSYQVYFANLPIGTIIPKQEVFLPAPRGGKKTALNSAS